MILTDFSGVFFATLHQDIKVDPNPTKNSIRHMCLNTIRSYNKQYRHMYGELMLILDSKSWREKVFPEYKWVRRQTREEEVNVDWDKVWDILNDVVQELQEFMPYRCIKANGAEADDIIGYICRVIKNEKILILSNDKDMGVLTSLPNVTQIRPYDNKEYNVCDPFRVMFELILTGDRDDGVPNVKCRDDFFVKQYWEKKEHSKSKNAPPISAKMKNECWEKFCKSPDGVLLKEYLGEEFYKNFERNTKLIDLLNNHAPEDVVNNIKTALENSKNNPQGLMLKFFQDNHMHLLAKYLDDFNIHKIEPTLY